jgi:hypothetical protein
LKKNLLHNITWLTIALTAVTGCHFGHEKKLNRLITLWRKDKIPYGTFYTHENMKYMFPRAKIVINDASPAKYGSFYSVPDELSNSIIKPKKAYIIICPRVIPTEYEVSAMMSFVGEGNYIFISTFYVGDSLMKSINSKTAVSNNGFILKDTLRVNVKNPISHEDLTFTYPGDAYSSYASGLDSAYTSILGTDKDGRANFIRFDYKGGGAIFLHLAPMTLTNFFLLHAGNKAYFDNVFSYIPQSVTEVKWDDYFRYAHYGNFSSLRFLLSNPSFVWAFWLMLLLFALIYLFESKRRQRVISAIIPLTNSSVDFVKTVGRLYYQRRDNLNLANKISVHFLGHVRSKYNLQTSSLEKEFTDRLSYKSGYKNDLVKNIVGRIKWIQQQRTVSDEILMAFNEEIEEFYKQT